MTRFGLTPADGLVVAVAVIGIGLLAMQVWRPSGAAEWAELRCGDGAPQRVMLDQHAHIELQCRIGISRIAIEPGRARFEDAPCTHRVCVRAGWLSRSGDTAACLPNGVSLRLGGHGTTIDAISG